MPLDVPIIPVNLGAAARTAPTPGPKDLTPAIATLIDSYKKGFIDTTDIQKAGMESHLNKEAFQEHEEEHLQDQHDKEIIRALQGRGAMGTPVFGGMEGGAGGSLGTPSSISAAYGGMAGGALGL